MCTPKIPIVLMLLLFFNIFSVDSSFAQETRPAKIGGAFGSLPLNELSNQNDSAESSGQHHAPAAALSELVGMYELVSFTVTYRSGYVFRSSNYNFYDDMAVSSHNTIWQRFSITGFEIIALSATFSVNGNSFTAIDDFYGESSHGSFSWDGTYLTTTVYDGTAPDPFTEVDVWKRVLSGNKTKTVILPIF